MKKILTSLAFLITSLNSGFLNADTIAQLAWDKTNLAVGDEVELTIKLKDLPAVYGTQIQASFNSRVLMPLDSDQQKQGVQAKAENLISSPQLFWVKNTLDGKTGKIEFINTLLHPAKPIRGSGLVFSAKFKALKPGAADLQVQNLKFGTAAGKSLRPKLIFPKQGLIVDPVGLNPHQDYAIHILFIALLIAALILASYSIRVKKRQLRLERILLQESS